MNSTAGSGPRHLQWHKACLQTLQEQTDKASMQDEEVQELCTGLLQSWEESAIQNQPTDVSQNHAAFPALHRTP